MSSQPATRYACPEWCTGSHKANDQLHTSEVLREVATAPNDAAVIELGLWKYDEGTPEETQIEINFGISSSETSSASTTLTETCVRDLAATLPSLADDMAARSVT